MVMFMFCWMKFCCGWLDLFGCFGLEWQVAFLSVSVGGYDIVLFFEFFQGFVNYVGVILYVDVLWGWNVYHIIETVFKVFGRALRSAVAHDARMGGVIPSTKGAL